MSKAYPRSLRRKLVIVALTLVVVIQLAAVAISGYNARQNSISVAEDAIRRDGDTAIESILRHLEPAEQSVEVTARLLASGVLDAADAELERYLYTQLAVMPQVNGAFVGFPDGSFVFVTTDEDGFRSKRIATDPERVVTVDRFDDAFDLTSTETLLDDEYDPVARPWYGLAAASESTAWTEPYVFFTSQKPGVTASRAVRVDGDIVAVVGIDVELTGLGEFLDDTASTEFGEAFVVSDGNVVAAPSRYDSQVWVEDDGSVRLMTTSELGVPELVDTGSFAVSRMRHGGIDELVLRKPFPADQELGWDVVVRAPEAEFTAVVADQQRMSLMIMLGGAAFIFVALGVMLRVSRPIKDLHEMASTDPLTGLANRRQIHADATELLRDVRPQQRVAVLAVDLDRFKALNDTQGHHAGDRALIAVAGYLSNTTRRSEIVGRLGGDEFVVVQCVATTDDAVAMANRILLELRQCLAVEFPDSDLGVSGGLTVGSGSDDFDALLLEADAALIAAKHESRGMLQLSGRVVDAAKLEL